MSRDFLDAWRLTFGDTSAGNADESGVVVQGRSAHCIVLSVVSACVLSTAFFHDELFLLIHLHRPLALGVSDAGKACSSKAIPHRFLGKAMRGAWGGTGSRTMTERLGGGRLSPLEEI